MNSQLSLTIPALPANTTLCEFAQLLARLFSPMRSEREGEEERGRERERERERRRRVRDRGVRGSRMRKSADSTRITHAEI